MDNYFSQYLIVALYLACGISQSLVAYNCLWYLLIDTPFHNMLSIFFCGFHNVCEL
jgi:hypothetical protein